MKKSTVILRGELFIHNSGIAIKEHDCFLCKIQNRLLLHYTLVCDVQNPPSGRRIIGMFDAHNENAGINMVTNTDGVTGTQITVGVCENHYGQLLRLCNITKDNRITHDRVSKVMLA